MNQQYCFGIVNVDVFFYKFGQSRYILTSDKNYMQNKKDRKEYYELEGPTKSPHKTPEMN